MILNVIENIYSLLSNDSTIKSYSTYVTSAGVDTIQSFPSITIDISSSETLTFPFNGNISELQITVWSENNKLEVENISEAVKSDMNYLRSDQSTTKIYWILKTSETDESEKDRKLWYKVMRFKVWSVD